MQASTTSGDGLECLWDELTPEEIQKCLAMAADYGTLVGFMMVADMPEQQLFADVSPRGYCKNHW